MSDVAGALQVLVVRVRGDSVVDEEPLVIRRQKFFERSETDELWGLGLQSGSWAA